MAYSFPWNNAVPAGSDPANQLDTFITDLKSAVSERMEDKLIQSMTADPWVVKPEILGNVDGKILTFHYSEGFLPFNEYPAGSFALTDKSIRNDITGSNVGFRIPLVLPDGVIIQEFHAWMAKGSNNTVATLNYGTYDSSFTVNPISTLTRTSATFGEESGLALAHTVDLSLYVYFIEVTLGRNAGTFGFGRIAYDTPDCRSTI